MRTMVRSEILAQGTLWGTKEYILYPPGYLIRYGPPQGDVPYKVWTLQGRGADAYHYFSTEAEVLAFLTSCLGDEVRLETERERQVRLGLPIK